MNKRIIAAAVAAAMTPAIAMADDINYSYAEINYVDIDVDAGAFGSASESGFGLEGSYSINDMFHVGFDYSSVDGLDQTSFGFGYHREMGSAANFYADLAWEQIDVDGFGDDDGYSIELGLRGMVGANFELQGYVGQIDVGGSETFFGVAGRYFFNDNMAIGLGYENMDSFGIDVTTLELGFRYNF
jgi:hypothetical protein